jgi:nucleotide-binding universal stress UspA family protein
VRPGRPTVIVGVDGTPTSWGAFSWACGEARRIHGHVIAVYVSATTVKSLSSGAAVAGFDAGNFAAAMNRTSADQASRLRAEIAARAAGLEVEVSFRHVHGDPAERLRAIARETHADLVAIGRSTQLRHRLFGSLGRRLIRDRSAPIVVIVP